MHNGTYFEKADLDDFIDLLKKMKIFFNDEEEYKSWINKQCELYKPTKEEYKKIKEEIK